MSYLNVYDTEAAWRLVHAISDGDPAAVVIKHANPCGAAVGADLTVAYSLAHEGDPVSAFGGIVAVNGRVPVALAEKLGEVFTEVIVAPAFDEDAMAVLMKKKNLRIIEAPPLRGVLGLAPAPTASSWSRTGRRLASAPASRTDATQDESPHPKLMVALRAERAPATRSSRSAMVLTLRSRQAAPR